MSNITLPLRSVQREVLKHLSWLLVMFRHRVPGTVLDLPNASPRSIVVARNYLSLRGTNTYFSIWGSRGLSPDFPRSPRLRKNLLPVEARGFVCGEEANPPRHPQTSVNLEARKPCRTISTAQSRFLSVVVSRAFRHLGDQSELRTLDPATQSTQQMGVIRGNKDKIDD